MSTGTAGDGGGGAGGGVEEGPGRSAFSSTRGGGLGGVKRRLAFVRPHAGLLLWLPWSLSRGQCK